MRAQVYRGQVIDNATEARIVEGCRKYHHGGYTNMRAAAADMNVPYHSFRRRLKGITRSHKKAHEDQRLLTPGQEAALVDWMKYLGMTGHPINKRTLRPKVESLLPPNKRRPISKSWIHRFEARHPEIKLGRGYGLDMKRARAFRYDVVHAHFKLLKELMEEHDIPWENVYNMDEKGIQLGGGRNGSRMKFFFSREDKAQYKVSNDDLQLVTIIEVVCADGSADIKPGFVFSGVTQCPEWYDEPGAVVATSENGWTDDFIGLSWFELGFIPGAKKRNTSGKPILLIYDGHGSHTTVEMIDKAREHGVHLFCLPPHTTHKLQPLDVGVFGPLQNAWFDRCDTILEETGEGMDVRDVVREYMIARRKSFKSETILKAWKKSGIRPINPEVFTAADYAPSHFASRSRHAPSTFPTRLPRCFDASSDDILDDGRPTTTPAGDSASESDSDSSESELESDESAFDPDSDSEGEVEEDADEASLPITTPARACHQRKLMRSEYHVPTTRSRAGNAPTPTPSHAPMPTTLAAAHARIYELQAAVEAASYERDSAQTHAVFISRENSVIKHQKKKQAERQQNPTPRLNVNARVMTSEQGRAEAEKARKAREDKQKAEAEKKKKKEDKAASDRQRRANLGSTIFAGGLSQKNKTELGDIAAALNLQVEGSKQELRERIDTYFNNHPEMKEDHRYLALFPRRGQKRPSDTADNEDEQRDPPAERGRVQVGFGAVEGVAGPSNVLQPITNQYLHAQGEMGVPYFPVQHLPHYPPYFGTNPTPGSYP